MNKVIISLAVLAVFSQVASAIPAPPKNNQEDLIVDDIRCVLALLENIQNTNNEIGNWITELNERQENLDNLQARCESIALSDPPTFLENLERTACFRQLWSARAFENARMISEFAEMLQKYPAIFSGILNDFQECVAD